MPYMKANDAVEKLKKEKGSAVPSEFNTSHKYLFAIHTGKAKNDGYEKANSIQFTCMYVFKQKIQQIL
jgi:hypothetical protein